MAELLPVTEWPDDFGHPPEFVRVVEAGLTRLEPWSVLQGEYLRNKHVGLQSAIDRDDSFPSRNGRTATTWLVGNLARRGNVVIVHDFASRGWEQRAELMDFHAWLREAVEDFITFEQRPPD